MNGQTPGQAAYEAMHASIAQRQPAHLWLTWAAIDDINEGIPGEPLRADMDAAARAAVVAAAPAPDTPDVSPLAVLAAELRVEADSAPAGSVGFAVSQVKYKIAARIEQACAAPAAPQDGGADRGEIDRIKTAAQLKLDNHRAEIDSLRELLDEVGVMAANAPEDGDSFGLLEEIAMRIAAHGVPDEPQPETAEQAWERRTQAAGTAPQPAPELAAATPESGRLRDLLDEATRTMLNLGTRPAEVNLARRIRKQAGLEP